MLDVKAIRTHRRQSQEAFAKSVGVDQATVSRWENGQLEPMGPAKILLEQMAAEAEADKAASAPAEGAARDGAVPTDAATPPADPAVSGAPPACKAA